MREAIKDFSNALYIASKSFTDCLIASAVFLAEFRSKHLKIPLFNCNSWYFTLCPLSFGRIFLALCLLEHFAATIVLMLLTSSKGQCALLLTSKLSNFSNSLFRRYPNCRVMSLAMWLSGTSFIEAASQSASTV